MTILVTGSAGHLGEAVLRTLRGAAHLSMGLIWKPSAFTDAVGSILDPDFVRRQMEGVTAVIHTATLHKPHVATHTKQDFVDTNVTGTLNLLEAAVAAGVSKLRLHQHHQRIRLAAPPRGGTGGRVGHRGPAAGPEEHLRHDQADGGDFSASCSFASADCRSSMLRTSRFFPEDDDDPAMRVGSHARRTRRPTSCSIAGWI